MTARASILDQLSSLADSTRSRLLLLLERHELTVGELCTVVQLPQSTVSRHLKVLSDERWVTSRGEATSRYYMMSVAQLDPAARELWTVVRSPIDGVSPAKQDARRAAQVLAKRRTKMRLFFSDAASSWDTLRTEMIGERTDLLGLMELMDDRWVVGDLGCGVGHATEAIAPCVAQVIAVDESGPMLTEARDRLGKFTNDREMRERDTSNRYPSMMIRSTSRCSFSLPTSSPTRRRRCTRSVACSSRVGDW